MLGLEHFVANHPFVSYAVIFIGMFIEGEIFFLTGTLFTIKGHLNWLPLIIVSFGGVFLGDLAWYFFGRASAQTHFRPWLEKRMHRYHGWIGERFGDGYFHTALFSKFIYYVNRAVPFFAGWHRMSLKKFAKTHFFTGLLWIGAIAGVGFLLQNLVIAVGVKPVLRRLELVIIGLIILFVGGEYLVKRVLFKRIVR